jgi:general secretion pathway protein L
LTASLQNSITAAAANFWRWWQNELVQLLPMTIRSRLQHRQLLPVVVYSETQWELWTPSLANNRAARVKQTVLDMNAEPEVRLPQAREAIAKLASPVAALMPASLVLRRTLTLPMALEENLKQALAYDLDRHTPFRSDELYFDAQVISRNPARGEIQIVLATTQRIHADRIMAQLREAGAEVVALLADPPENIESKLNLLPSEDRPSWQPWQRWAIGGGVALIVLLLLAAIAFPIGQKRAYAIKVRDQASAAQAQAMAVTKLKDEMDQLVADHDFVPDNKEAYPSTVHVLDEITKLLPDDTWLTQMEIKNTTGSKETRHEVFLRGESAHASRLVTLLEESGLVAQAAPRSPITTIRTAGGGTAEMFDVGAQIKKQPPPERVAVMIEGKVAPPPPLPAPPAKPITPMPMPVVPESAAPVVPAAAPATPAAPPAAAPAMTPAVPVAQPAVSSAPRGRRGRNAAANAAPAPAAAPPVIEMPVEIEMPEEEAPHPEAEESE